ncbi:MAG: hypothetical protein ABT940_05570 [Alphaproteobacteria bacterium]
MVIGCPFNREQLLAALDRIGEAAVAHDTVMEIAVYGGSALMLASRFRYATEDVDIGELPTPWPDWLTEITRCIAKQNDWSPDWLNDAVQFHLSPLADHAVDHLEFATFPPGEVLGLRVYVPTADYLLALKLKAISRINDPAKGPQEIADIRNLLRAAGVQTIDGAIDVLAKFFPKSAADADKYRFFLRHLWSRDDIDEPPAYPVLGR